MKKVIIWLALYSYIAITASSVISFNLNINSNNFYLRLLLVMGLIEICLTLLVLKSKNKFTHFIEHLHNQQK